MGRRILVLSLALLSFWVPAVFAAELLVPGQYPTIQAAIDDANNGDTVIVAPGTYTGDGNRDIDFLGKAIAVRSINPNDPNIVEATIINCNGSESEPHRGFYFHSGEDANSFLAGLTVINGHHDDGGAIACVSSGPTISNCIISNNTSNNAGGGIHTTTSASTITNCTIVGNSSRNGGAICFANSNDDKVVNCRISNNTAATYGGAILCYDNGNPTIKSCSLTANIAESKGGAICCFYESNPNIFNCTFAGNLASDGNTLACDSYNQVHPSDVHLTNCILADDGSEIANHDYSIIDITYSNVPGGWPGLGNIDVDPCFVDPGYWIISEPPDDSYDDDDYDEYFWVNGDYHLKSQAGRWNPNIKKWVKDPVTSPAIDAGDMAAPIGAESFPNGGIINMGAYGGTEQASKSYFGAPVCKTIVAGDINGDCKVDFLDFNILAKHWLEAYGPTIDYEVTACTIGKSSAVQSETRFTVTVDGRYIHFEDMMAANCCTDEIELQMAIQGNVITIYEREHTSSPCHCICDYPVTATLGPFEPGAYNLEVYEDYGGFTGSVPVVIE